jgi:hypothetical protein
VQAWEKTRALCIIIVCGLLAAMAYHAVVGLVFGVKYPGNTFLFNPDIRFSDFYWIFESVQTGSPLSGKLSLYFPFAYLPLFPLAHLTWQVAYVVMLAFFVGSLFYFFWLRLAFLQPWPRIAAATIIPLLSAGVLFAIDRGNIDQLVLVFTLAFFGLFARGRYGWSAVPLAAAIAMKAYPGALGVLLLLRRQYKAAALTGVLTIVLTLGASALYPGGVTKTYQLWQARAAFLQTEYVANPVMHASSLSYLSIIKILSRVFGLDFAGNSGLVLLCYSVASAAIFIIVLAYIMLRESELWKQVYLLTFLLMVLPQVSFDYKLIYLMLPIALFLNASPGRRDDDIFYIGMLGILLIPKAYYPLDSETKISGVLNPFALTAIAAHIMWVGVRRPRAERENLAGAGNPTA